MELNKKQKEVKEKMKTKERKGKEKKMKNLSKRVNLKENKAITLIALVVTIVVLLILAGISLNLVLGENGIITRAQEAKTKTEQDVANSEAALASLQDEMEEILSPTSWSYDGKGNVTDGTNTFAIGDYVNYSQFVDESKTATSVATENGWAEQTYKATKATTWRVLGVGSSGDLLLVSGSPIQKNVIDASGETWQKDPYFYMKGAYSYVNCVSALKNICSIYSSSIGTARSITIEDVNNALGVAKDGNTIYNTSDADKTNIDLVRVLGSSYTYKSGDYKPDANGGSLATAGETVNYDSYGYQISSTTASDTIKSLIMDGTTSSDNYIKSYWLASPGSHAYGSYAAFGPGYVGYGYAFCGFRGLFGSVGGWDCYGLAVRPVVSLGSKLSADTVAKLKTNPTETESVDWDSTYSAGNAAGSGSASTRTAGTGSTDEN